MALAVLWPSVGVGVNENTRGDSTPHLKIGSHSLWAHAAAVSACAPRGDTLLPHLINSSMSQRYQTKRKVYRPPRLLLTHSHEQDWSHVSEGCSAPHQHQH